MIGTNGQREDLGGTRRTQRREAAREAEEAARYAARPDVQAMLAKAADVLGPEWDVTAELDCIVARPKNPHEPPDQDQAAETLAKALGLKVMWSRHWISSADRIVAWEPSESRWPGEQALLVAPTEASR